MKIRIVILIIVSIFATLVSCSYHKADVIAMIDDEEISASLINKLVEKDIYDNICRIYDVRYEATREYVGLILLKKSADERGISVDSFLICYSHCHGTEYMSDEYLRKQLIDSLFDRYNAKILLDEPISPFIGHEQALSYVRGNLQSNVTLTEVSDFDCGLCSFMHRKYKSLYGQYSNKVKFEHIVFSADVSPSARAAYAAGLQDRYWDMCDTLFSIPTRVDSSMIVSLAVEMGFDMDQFMFDYSSLDNIDFLVKNNGYLSSRGIERTPTILINGHPLRKPENIEYIITQIDRALDEIH